MWLWPAASKCESIKVLFFVELDEDRERGAHSSLLLTVLKGAPNKKATGNREQYHTAESSS